MAKIEESADLRRRLEEAEEELERFRMTLEVVGTIDLDAGVLNRNGVLEALERGRRWLIRRGDLYGLVVVTFPGLVIDPTAPDDRESLKHLAASLSAAVREVDEVGRVEQRSFGAVLQDLRAGSIATVTGRMTELMAAVGRSIPAAGAETRIGGVEVHTPQPTSPAVLDAALDLARAARPGRPRTGQL